MQWRNICLRFWNSFQSIFVSSAFHLEHLQCNTHRIDESFCLCCCRCRWWMHKSKQIKTMECQATRIHAKRLYGFVDWAQDKCVFFCLFLIRKLCSTHAEMAWRYLQNIHSLMTHQRYSFFVFIQNWCVTRCSGGIVKVRAIRSVTRDVCHRRLGRTRTIRRGVAAPLMLTKW